MLEHYVIVKYFGDERHAALIREAELLRLISNGKPVIFCKACRVLGNFLVRIGKSLIAVDVETFEAAK
ncbi:MAG: hypothetical protein H8D65_01465 [Spirochaetes bacterium]|nr:hypothetical protein [Spirochaetota bacterium]MBL7005599.1 hypothetical protein [Spirochaetia bacterium]